MSCEPYPNSPLMDLRQRSYLHMKSFVLVSSILHREKHAFRFNISTTWHGLGFTTHNFIGPYDPQIIGLYDPQLYWAMPYEPWCFLGLRGIILFRLFVLEPFRLYDNPFWVCNQKIRTEPSFKLKGAKVLCSRIFKYWNINTKSWQQCIISISFELFVFFKINNRNL